MCVVLLTIDCHKMDVVSQLLHWNVILHKKFPVVCIRGWLQVVVRSGRAIAAVPPDYKLLDYDPEKHMYLYADTQLTNASFVENQGGMGRVRATLGSVEDCAELKSYPSQPLLNNSAEKRGSLMRGLSVVLPSESMSLPPPTRSWHGTSSVRSLHSQFHDMLPVLIRCLCPGDMHEVEDNWQCADS
jgi:hypothetical protein